VAANAAAKAVQVMLQEPAAAAAVAVIIHVEVQVVKEVVLAMPVVQATRVAELVLLHLMLYHLVQVQVTLSALHLGVVLLYRGILSDMNEKELKKLIEQKELAQRLKQMDSSDNRAQSISIGSAGGGTTEICMRNNTGTFLWNVYQPVEIVELIHQLASNIGCHLQIKPRQDFASWRDWKYTEEELLHYRGDQKFPGVGFAPHVNDLAPHQSIGANLPAPEQQPGLKLKQPKESKENVVAIKKNINQRSTKRAAKTT
jgi:hypothetical protein